MPPLLLSSPLIAGRVPQKLRPQTILRLRSPRRKRVGRKVSTIEVRQEVSVGIVDMVEAYLEIHVAR